MVKVSKLRSLDIYTNTGHYVGRVEDVVLNIRLGTISKLQVRAIEHERKPAGVINSFLGSIRGEVPEENDMKSFQDDVLTVDFDKVQAIGDIIVVLLYCAATAIVGWMTWYDTRDWRFLAGTCLYVIAAILITIWLLGNCA